MTSTRFYVAPGFCEGIEVRSKGQLTGAATVQTAHLPQPSVSVTLQHFPGVEQLRVLNP